MYSDLLTQLQHYSLQLITLGGSVNPYVGAAVALIVTGLLIFLKIKAGQEAWAEQKDKAGQAVNTNTGNEQKVDDNVLNKSDDFFGGKK